MAEPAEAVTLEEASEAAYDEHFQEPELEVVEESAVEAEEPEAEKPEASAEDQPEAEHEELLTPHEHWPSNIKEVFSTFNRSQQDAWMERERLVEAGFREKKAQFDSVNGAFSELQEMIKPLVPDWDRQGFTPSQGVRRLVTLEKDLRENPSEAVIRLARDYGVNLEQTIQDQPYVDPQTRAIQDELRREREWRENFERQQAQQAQQQQQAVQQQAVQQIQQYASSVDESGNLKYPYITDDTVLVHMTNAIQAGQAHDVLSAYDAAMNKLKSHPFFKDQVQQQTSQAQAVVQKAKNASKTVTGEAPSGKTSTNQDAETLRMLEEAGFE